MIYTHPAEIDALHQRIAELEAQLARKTEIIGQLADKVYRLENQAGVVAGTTGGL